MQENKETKKTDNKTGRYVYDARLGKVVKVSDDIPGLKKGASAADGCGCGTDSGGCGCGGGCCCGG